MRAFLLLLLAAFTVTLVAVVGMRVSMEGGAFVLGLACGVAASIPASLLALVLSRRTTPPAPPPAPYSPLVIMTSGPVQQRPPDYPPLSNQAQAKQDRPRYRIIGEE
jgi:hypothetical protein